MSNHKETLYDSTNQIILRLSNHNLRLNSNKGPYAASSQRLDVLEAPFLIGPVLVVEGNNLRPILLVPPRDVQALPRSVRDLVTLGHPLRARVTARRLHLQPVRFAVVVEGHVVER